MSADPTPTAPAGTRDPWPFSWDASARRRFWLTVESGPRGDQAFVRTCGRHLVATVAHWIGPGAHPLLAPRKRTGHLAATYDRLAAMIQPHARRPRPGGHQQDGQRTVAAAADGGTAPRSRVWDMGSRSSALSEVLLAAGYLTSVDDSELVDAEAVRWRLGSHPNFMALTARPEPHSMDAVFWIDGLPMLGADEALARLAAARQALRAGGILAVTAPNNEDLSQGLALCPSCAALFHQWQHVTSYTPESLEALLRAAGFDLLALQQLELTEAAFRSRPGLLAQLAANPRLHLGSGETLVGIARASATAEPATPIAEVLSPPAASPPAEPHEIVWTRDKVARFWDGIAITPLAKLGFGRQSGRHLLRAIGHWLRQEGRHLDYGAGNGDLAEILIKAGYPTATFEPSAEMRERQQARLGGLPGYLGVVTPDSTEVFDTVLLCEVIEHVLTEDLPEVLERLNRFLPIDGTLVITTPNGEDLAGATICCPSCETLFHHWQHVRAFDARSLEALLGQFGFAPYVILEVELTDAAFQASPYPEILFRAEQPGRFGSGNTLIYVGRKRAGPAGPLVPAPRLPVPESSGRALGMTAETPASCTGRSIKSIVDRIDKTQRATAPCAAVLFTQTPGVEVLWELGRDPRVGPILRGTTSGDDGATQQPPLAVCDLAVGSLPPGLALPGDLIVCDAEHVLGLRAGRAFGQAGVERIWFAPEAPEPWPTGDFIRFALLRTVSARIRLAVSRALGRWGAVRRAILPLARRAIPQRWHHSIRKMIDAARDWRLQRVEQARIAAAPSLREIAPLLPAAAFAAGPVIQVNNALAWGGVERQVVYVLKGLARMLPRPVALLCLRLHAGDDYRFYLPAVADEPVEVRDIRDQEWAEDYLAGHLSRAERDAVELALLRLPADVRIEARRFLAELLEKRPAVVHAWQDSASISAGFAAVLAGVPRIILSSRNMRPTNFAYHRPYMAHGYRALAEVERVVLVNNSEAGARDYAQWLGIEAGRYRVKRNGIDAALFQRATASEIAAYRANLGIPEDGLLVGSVFRLYEEKRPLLWVEMAVQVGERFPNAHFVIFGTGPLEAQARNLAKRRGLGDRLHLPGTTTDPHLAMSAMDVFVLTSRFEGTPNVLLEAQLLGVPVVATDAGGTREALEPGRTGWLVEEAEAGTLAERVAAILTEPAWRAQAREAGPQFVAARFGLERMLEETLALYGLSGP